MAIIGFTKRIIKRFLLRSRIKENSKKCTLKGDHHLWGIKSNIQLQWGSTSDDIEINDHAEVYGTLISIGHGKIIMDEWSKLGEGCVVYSVNKVVIGKDVAITANVTITDNNFHPTNPEDRRYMRHTSHDSRERSAACSANKPVIIGENVWLGSNSRICKGVTIGDNAIIASCAVVTKDVPANSIAAGNPARIVKTDIDKETTPIFPLI